MALPKTHDHDKFLRDTGRLIFSKYFLGTLFFLGALFFLFKHIQAKRLAMANHRTGYKPQKNKRPPKRMDISSHSSSRITQLEGLEDNEELDSLIQDLIDGESVNISKLTKNSSKLIIESTTSDNVTNKKENKFRKVGKYNKRVLGVNENSQPQRMLNNNNNNSNNNNNNNNSKALSPQPEMIAKFKVAPELISFGEKGKYYFYNSDLLAYFSSKKFPYIQNDMELLKGKTVIHGSSKNTSGWILKDVSDEQKAEAREWDAKGKWYNRGYRIYGKLIYKQGKFELYEINGVKKKHEDKGKGKRAVTFFKSDLISNANVNNDFAQVNKELNRKNI